MKGRKIFAWFLALTMVLTMLPTMAFAEEAVVEENTAAEGSTVVDNTVTEENTLMVANETTQVTINGAVDTVNDNALQETDHFGAVAYVTSDPNVAAEFTIAANKGAFGTLTQSGYTKVQLNKPANLSYPAKGTNAFTGTVEVENAKEWYLIVIATDTNGISYIYSNGITSKDGGNKWTISGGAKQTKGSALAISASEFETAAPLLTVEADGKGVVQVNTGEIATGGRTNQGEKASIVLEYCIKDESVELVATADTGYKFVNWTTTDGKEVSTANSWTSVVVEGDATYVAHFAANDGTGQKLKKGEYVTGGSGKVITNLNGSKSDTITVVTGTGSDIITVPAGTGNMVRIGTDEATGTVYTNGSDTEDMVLVVTSGGHVKLDSGKATLSPEGVIYVGRQDTKVTNSGDKDITVAAVESGMGNVQIPEGGKATFDEMSDPIQATKGDARVVVDADGGLIATVEEGTLTIGERAYVGTEPMGAVVVIEEKDEVYHTAVMSETYEPETEEVVYYALNPGASVTIGKYIYTAPDYDFGQYAGDDNLVSAAGDVSLWLNAGGANTNPHIVLKNSNLEKRTWVYQHGYEAYDYVTVTLKDNPYMTSTYEARDEGVMFTMAADDSNTRSINMLGAVTISKGADQNMSYTPSADHVGILAFNDNKTYNIDGISYYQSSAVGKRSGYSVTFVSAGSPTLNWLQVGPDTTVNVSMDENDMFCVNGVVGDDNFNWNGSKVFDGRIFIAKNDDASVEIRNNTVDMIGGDISGNKSVLEAIESDNEIIGYYVTKKRSSSGGESESSGGGGGATESAYSITIKDAEHGSISADKKSAAKDATITLSLTADEGYAMEKLSITDAKGNEIAATEKSAGVYTFKMPAGNVTVAASFAADGCPKDESCPLYIFKDLKTDGWYHDGIHYCLDKKLMYGISADAFLPDGSVTRGQIVTILWRQEGSPTAGASTFGDVAASDYYATAVAWAAENGIVSGYGNGKFGPKDSITREQLAAILYRYAAYKGMDTKSTGEKDIKAFGDYGKISAYALDAMAWAVDQGIISGTSLTTLEPDGTATRAQAASLMQRFLTK